MSRVLFVSDDDLAGELDLCLRAMDDGWQTKWFFQRTEKNKDVGKGLVDVVDDWRAWMRWADLVILAGNTRYMREMDAWRERGSRIIGATVASAAWELDRMLGQEVFEEHGIPVPSYEEFSDYDAAIAYVKKEMRRFVSKPCGDEPDKSLSYCSKSPEDLIYMLERWKKADRLKGNFILQEFIPGIEMAVGGWIGPNGFLKGWCENWEEKKLMAGNCGPTCGEAGTTLRYVAKSRLAYKVLKPLEDAIVATGHTGYVDVNCIIDEKGNAHPLEFTCYDAETEVLTESGWKLFQDVALGEKMATLDPVTDEMTFIRNTAVIAKHHSGEMVHFKADNGGCDLLVTPDHQMWVEPAKQTFRFKRADSIGRALHKVRRGYTWRGREQAVFSVPAYTEAHVLGRHKKLHPIEHAARPMQMEVWMRFLGLYISEGSLGRRGYQIHIAQSPKNLAKILPLLEGFPFKGTVHSSGVTYSSIQLGKYLRALGMGLAPQKFVPREFMDLAPKYLAALLEGLIAGDGSTHKRSGQRGYYTTSKLLADQVQELMTKVGGLGRIQKGLKKGSQMTIRGREYTRNHDGYCITERREKVDAWLDTRMTETVQYDGPVYCCDVPPHHLLYVRRKGVPVWCGNCRFGWPTINIQTALHQGDSIQWLADLADGRASPPWETDTIAVGSVVAMGDYPHSHLTKKEVVGIPIYGLKDKVQEQIHYCSVMMGEAPQETNGKIIKAQMPVTAGDYLLVATGTGEDVRSARAKAYKAIKSLEIPSSPFWRIDIGERLRKELPILQEQGFAQAMRY